MPCAPHRLLRHLRSAILALLAGSAIIAAAAQHSSWAAELSRVAFSRFATNGCPASGSCGVDFGTVPGTAKRRYEITHVSCYVVIGNASARPGYWFLFAQRSGATIGRIQLRPSLLGNFSTEVTYNANEQGLVVVPGGGLIAVTVSRDNSTTGFINNHSCSIGGYDVRLE